MVIRKLRVTRYGTEPRQGASSPTSSAPISDRDFQRLASLLLDIEHDFLRQGIAVRDPHVHYFGVAMAGVQPALVRTTNHRSLQEKSGFATSSTSSKISISRNDLSKIAMCVEALLVIGHDQTGRHLAAVACCLSHTMQLPDGQPYAAPLALGGVGGGFTIGQVTTSLVVTNYQHDFLRQGIAVRDPHVHYFGVAMAGVQPALVRTTNHRSLQEKSGFATSSTSSKISISRNDLSKIAMCVEALLVIGHDRKSAQLRCLFHGFPTA